MGARQSPTHVTSEEKEMENKTRVCVWAGVILCTALCFALPALAQNSTLSFNGGYQGAVWCGGSEGCVATGFYDGSINGVQVGPGQPGGPGMICDDYNHNIVAGENWTANGIDVANLNSSNIDSTQFGKQLGTSAIQVYTELAYLVNQMFTTNPNATNQAFYSEALWYLTGGVTQGQIQNTQAWAYVQAAIAFFNNGGSLSQFANLMLYTPTNQGSTGPQEMWGEVAALEGGAAWTYLLLAGVACFGAVFFRRQVRI